MWVDGASQLPSCLSSAGAPGAWRSGAVGQAWGEPWGGSRLGGQDKKQTGSKARTEVSADNCWDSYRVSLPHPSHQRCPWKVTGSGSDCYPPPPVSNQSHSSPTKPTHLRNYCLAFCFGVTRSLIRVHSGFPMRITPLPSGTSLLWLYSGGVKALERVQQGQPKFQVLVRLGVWLSDWWST